MSLAEIKERAAALSEPEKRELSAFLEYLLDNDRCSPAEAARRIDDRDPRNWIPWETLKKQLNDLP